MSDLRSKHFEDLVQLCSVCQMQPQQAATAAHSSTLRARLVQKRMTYELYLPTPSDIDSATALDFHLTTRNFFAWMYNVPVVGKSLGRALVAVHERMNDYRPYIERNRVDMLTYLENQGYYDFRMCADHSLAALYFAETFEMPTLWRNAFAHSVGMCEMLYSSGEYQNVSRVTRALIMKANLDMEGHLERVTASLGSMFEDFTSASSMGLSQSLRDHLDRFRSFLITLHIERHGFWPPHNLSNQHPTFPKTTLMSLYLEFRCLYEFLVDPDSAGKGGGTYRARTGLDAEQVIETFDQKHGFEPLPFRLPLLPRDPSRYLDEDDADQPASPQSPRNKLNPLQLNPMRRGKVDKLARRKALWKSLAEATNYDPKTYKTLIIRRYIEFEQETLIEIEEEKIKMSIADGRRVRWVLVYGILQVLVSVVQAPDDVSDMEGIEYPLCCKIPKVMPWNMDFEHLPYTTAAASGPDGDYYFGSSKSVKFDVDDEVERLSSHPNGSSGSLASSRDAGSVTPTLSGRSSEATSRSSPTNDQRNTVETSTSPRSKVSRRISLPRFLTRKPSNPEANSKVPEGGIRLEQSIEQDSTPSIDFSVPEPYLEPPSLSSVAAPVQHYRGKTSDDGRVSPLHDEHLTAEQRRRLANRSPVSSMTESTMTSDSTISSSMSEDQVWQFPPPPIMQSVVSSSSSSWGPSSTKVTSSGPTMSSISTVTSSTIGRPTTTSFTTTFQNGRSNQLASDAPRIGPATTSNDEPARPGSSNTIRASKKRSQEFDVRHELSDPNLRSISAATPSSSMPQKNGAVHPPVSSPTPTSSNRVARVPSDIQLGLRPPPSDLMPDSPTYPPISPPSSRSPSVAPSPIDKTTVPRRTPPPSLTLSNSQPNHQPVRPPAPLSTPPIKSSPSPQNQHHLRPLSSHPSSSSSWLKTSPTKSEYNLPPSPTTPTGAAAMTPAPLTFTNPRTPPSPPTFEAKRTNSMSQKLLSYWKPDPSTAFNPPPSAQAQNPSSAKVKMPSNVIRVAGKQAYKQGTDPTDFEFGFTGNDDPAAAAAKRAKSLAPLDPRDIIALYHARNKDNPNQQPQSRTTTATAAGVGGSGGGKSRKRYSTQQQSGLGGGVNGLGMRNTLPAITEST